VLVETFVARAEHHPTVSSTSDRAAECAGCPAEELPLLVVADAQTAGRGRGSNRWWTGPGSLAFSVLLDRPDTPPAPQGTRAGPSPLLEPIRDPAPLAPLAARGVGGEGFSDRLLSLAAGVAVAQALAPLLPGQPLGLHWPNDVVVGEKKLSGVLVEVLTNRRPVIGIGLNVNNTADTAPKELRRRIATLRDLTGREHDRTAVLIAVLRNLADALHTLADAPEQLAAEADRLCLQRGRVLRLFLGRKTVEGRCGGIAPDGALLLDTPRGCRTFYSGTLLD